MQRIARSSIPPNRNNNTPSTNINSDFQNESPAFLLALRIKNEQGAAKAAEFLLAMEPYLAPFERMHISSRLGLPNVQKQAPKSMPSQQGTGNVNFTMPQNNNFNMPGMGGFNMPNMGGGMNPMALINMLSGINSMQKNNSNSMDPAMISKLMSIMGKK